MKHEINSQNTKQMLTETFVSLLHNKPISKITVSELVSLCDINRKTFYYHFSDVYALLEWHLEKEVSKATEALNPLDDFGATISYAASYMTQNHYLRNCIDNPLGRDKIIQFLNRSLFPKAEDIITKLEHRYQTSLDADFKDFLVRSLTRVIVLSIIDNIETPNAYDIERMRLYLSDIFKASIEGFFKNIKS